MTRAVRPDPPAHRKHHHDGTHRARPPEHTWAWLSALLGRHGITRVADITGLDDIGIPVFQAVRPAATTLSVSQGKGLTPLLAKVSAVMESVEFWHAERISGAFGLVPARAWGRLPYPWRRCSPAAGSMLHDDLPIEWLPGECLVTGRETVVPLGCVRIDHTYAAEWAPPLFSATTNGLAGGNTVVEATVHALCEVIERDTSAGLPAVPGEERAYLRLETVSDGHCRALLDRFAAAGAVLDVRYDTGRVGLHLFQVLGRSPTAPFGYSGFGAHPDHRVALARALTEAAQSRVTGIAGSRDDDETPDRGGAPRAVVARVPDGRPVHWADLADTSARSLDGDTAVWAERIAAVTGVEPIRVVLPSPTGVPVVRVVAPGLRFAGHVVAA